MNYEKEYFEQNYGVDNIADANIEYMKAEQEKIIEYKALIAGFMGHKPEVEYCVGSDKEGTVCYSPKNVDNYFPDQYSQKRECERWLKEQREKYPEGWVTKGDHTVRRFEWYADYDNDWNLLMPVVEKIAKMGHRIELTFTQVDTSAHIRGEDELHCPFYSKSIDAVYTLCVQFITWYNQTQLK